LKYETPRLFLSLSSTIAPKKKYAQMRRRYNAKTEKTQCKKKKRKIPVIDNARFLKNETVRFFVKVQVKRVDDDDDARLSPTKLVVVEDNDAN